MKADNKTRKQFRAIGHRLHPVVIISNGISDNVDNEIDRALTDHELIKIRINAADREEKAALVASICERHDAEMIQMSGHTVLLYKAARKPNEKLSNLHRHKDLLA
jgi:RNA-binding protein